MGADNYSWSLRGRGEDEYDARVRAEHVRFKNALEAIRRICADDALDPLGRIESLAASALSSSAAGDKP